MRIAPVLCLSTIAALLLINPASQAQDGAISRCRTIKDDAARLACFDARTALPKKPSQRAAASRDSAPKATLNDRLDAANDKSSSVPAPPKAAVKPTPSTASSGTGALKPDPHDPNEANKKLMALSESARRAFFFYILNTSGERCLGEVNRTLYQGSAKPSWNALWSVACSGGPSYLILVMSDEVGSSKVLTCGEARARGVGQCWVRY